MRALVEAGPLFGQNGQKYEEWGSSAETRKLRRSRQPQEEPVLAEVPGSHREGGAEEGFGKVFRSMVKSVASTPGAKGSS